MVQIQVFAPIPVGPDGSQPAQQLVHLRLVFKRAVQAQLVGEACRFLDHLLSIAHCQASEKRKVGGRKIAFEAVWVARMVRQCDRPQHHRLNEVPFPLGGAVLA